MSLPCTWVGKSSAGNMAPDEFTRTSTLCVCVCGGGGVYRCKCGEGVYRCKCGGEYTDVKIVFSIFTMHAIYSKAYSG